MSHNKIRNILIQLVKEKYVADMILQQKYELEHREKYSNVMGELLRTMSHTSLIEIEGISESSIVRRNKNIQMVSSYEWIGFENPFADFNGLYISTTHFLESNKYYTKRTDILDIDQRPTITREIILNIHLGTLDIYRPIYQEDLEDEFGDIHFPLLRRSQSI